MNEEHKEQNVQRSGYLPEGLNRAFSVRLAQEGKKYAHWLKEQVEAYVNQS